MIYFLASIAFVLFWEMNHMWNPYLKFKPFNCVPCLSVWVALLLCFINKEIVEVIFYCFSAGVIAPLLKHWLKL